MTPVDFFETLRCWGGKRNVILDKLKIYGIWNMLVCYAANVVLPVYFICTQSSMKHRLRHNDNALEKPQVVMSLTSFPKRLPRLWLVIECLLRQTVKPDRLILYLTASQVPDIEKLPRRLLAQRRRGLEIRLCDKPIRSHTKYFDAMQQFPESIVITVDDDLFYRSTLVERHLKHHGDHPDCVITNWAKVVISGKSRYDRWPDAAEPTLAKNLMILGVSSVLYPPHSVHPDAFDPGNIQKLSLTADDVWLSAQIFRQGTPVYFTAEEFRSLPVLIRNNETLISGNYARNQICVDAINNHYASKGEPTPFPAHKA